MQPQYTGTQLRKKDRHRTRKFSEDEPYDRATDDMLANSALSGGRKFSLQQGTLIQAQSNSLKQDVSPQNFTPQQSPSAMTNTSLTTNPNLTTASQNYIQPGLINTTSSNMPMNYGTQNFVQPGLITTTGTNMPMSYGTQGLAQPGFINNTGFNTPMNYGTEGLTQQAYTTTTGTEGLTQQSYVVNSGSEAFTQPNNFTSGIPMDYNAQGLTQQNFSNNMGTTTEQTYTQSGLMSGNQVEQNLGMNPSYITNTGTQSYVQPGLISGNQVEQNLGMNPNYIANTGTQSYTQPGLISGAVIGTGLAMGTIYGASTIPQNLNQSGMTNTSTQSMTQPELNKGFVNTTQPSNTETSMTQPPMSDTKKMDSNAAGVFTFKPLEGKFPKDKDVVGKMDPYCKIKIGMHSGKTAVAKSQGTHPVWNDVITLQKKHNEQFAKLKIRDHDRLRLNEVIGETKIPLGEIASRGKTNMWYPIYKKDQLAGEVLMEITFQPKSTAM